MKSRRVKTPKYQPAGKTSYFLVAKDFSRYRIETVSARVFLHAEDLEMECYAFLSPKILETYKIIDKAAVTDSLILFSGEAGVGKESLARVAHVLSPRRAGPYHSAHCGMLSDAAGEIFGSDRESDSAERRGRRGLFELARGGTLVLHDFAALDEATQAGILAAMESGRFKRAGGQSEHILDTRLIVTVAQDPHYLAQANKLIPALFYRMWTCPLVVAPLRQRPEDVETLSGLFLNRYSRQLNKPINAISSEAMEILVRYPWPGNIRELKNTIERIVITKDAGVVQPKDLPSDIVNARERPQEAEPLPQSAVLPGFAPAGERKSTITLEKFLEQIEKDLIMKILRQTNNNQTRTAQQLGIRRDTLRYRMKKLKLI